MERGYFLPPSDRTPLVSIIHLVHDARTTLIPFNRSVQNIMLTTVFNNRFFLTAKQRNIGVNAFDLNAIVAGYTEYARPSVLQRRFEHKFGLEKTYFFARLLCSSSAQR